MTVCLIILGSANVGWILAISRYYGKHFLCISLLFNPLETLGSILFSKEGNWALERLSNLSKISQLTRCEPEIQTHEVWPLILYSLNDSICSFWSCRFIISSFEFLKLLKIALTLFLLSSPQFDALKGWTRFLYVKLFFLCLQSWGTQVDYKIHKVGIRFWNPLLAMWHMQEYLINAFSVNFNLNLRKGSICAIKSIWKDLLYAGGSLWFCWKNVATFLTYI